MARNIITGIDAGSSKIRVIIAEQKRGGGLHILGVSQRQSEGIKRGYIVNLDEAAKSINLAVRLAEKMAGLSAKKAFVVAGGISLSSIRSKGMVIISRADGEVADYDVKRVIDQSEANLTNISNKRILHAIPLFYKIDGSQVLGRPAGMKGTKLEVETFFITCLTQHLSDLIKAVENAGISIEDISAAPLAMSYAILTKNQKETGCVLVNIGASTVSIVVFEEGLPISLEVFPIGSTHITNDIALGLRIPLDEAEKMKLDYGINNPVPKRKLSDIIEARLNDIFELIESHLKKINRNGMLPAGIILTGSGSNLFSLEEIAKSSLELPAEIGTFGTKKNHSSLNITSQASNLKEQISNDPGWAVVLGLCIMNSEENILEANAFSETRGRVGQTIKKWLKSLMP